MLRAYVRKDRHNSGSRLEYRDGGERQSEGPEPRSVVVGVAWGLRPYEAAGEPSTGWLQDVVKRVPAPLGVVMVALPEVPRNASEARALEVDPAELVEGS
jgi:hypothetical protein